MNRREYHREYYWRTAERRRFLARLYKSGANAGRNLRIAKRREREADLSAKREVLRAEIAQLISRGLS